MAELQGIRYAGRSFVLCNRVFRMEGFVSIQLLVRTQPDVPSLEISSNGPKP